MKYFQMEQLKEAGQGTEDQLLKLMRNMKVILKVQIIIVYYIKYETELFCKNIA